MAPFLNDSVLDQSHQLLVTSGVPDDHQVDTAGEEERRLQKKKLQEQKSLSMLVQIPEPLSRLNRISDATQTMLQNLLGGHQLDCLEETSARYAKAMLFFTQGYHENLDQIIGDAVFDEDCRELVVVRDIEFHSLCEHHLVPFSGRVQIGYLADGEVLGLSKFARIVDMYARRLQVQERLTRDIAQAVQKVMQPRGVAVRVDATHLCMAMRGVEKSGSSTTTQYFLGDLKTDRDARQEFFAALQRC